jgi:hypothetical protein
VMFADLVSDLLAGPREAHPSTFFAKQETILAGFQRPIPRAARRASLSHSQSRGTVAPNLAPWDSPSAMGHHGTLTDPVSGMNSTPATSRAARIGSTVRTWTCGGASRRFG